MVLTDRRLKVKEGTHKTLWRVREDDRVMVPICVTEAVLPLDNLTTDWGIAVMEDKKFTEQTVETRGEQGLINARSYWHCSGVKAELVRLELDTNSCGWMIEIW